MYRKTGTTDISSLLDKLITSIAKPLEYSFFYKVYKVITRPSRILMRNSFDLNGTAICSGSKHCNFNHLAPADESDVQVKSII